jgi:hypothetical protein
MPLVVRGLSLPIMITQDSRDEASPLTSVMKRAFPSAEMAGKL